MSEAAALQTQTTQVPPSNSYSLLLQRKCACGGSSGLTGKCEECQRKPLRGKPLQAKLHISESGDKYEQEADRVAEQVMRMPDPNPRPETSKVPSTPLIQRRVVGSNTQAGGAPPIVHDVLSSPGQPLDAPTRAFFEPRFDHDFGRVRIHADPKAAESARSVNALAYTVGRDIVFDFGHYAPRMPEGRRLIAHELAHSVQQSQDASTHTTDRMSNHIAHIVNTRAAVPVTRRSPLAIARQPLDAQQAPSPPVERRLFEDPDPDRAIRLAIDTLESIRFVEADRYVLEAEGELREFDERQYQKLKITTRAKLRAGINSIRSRTSHVQNIYSNTLEVNDDYWLLTKAMEHIFGVDKPGEELTAEFVQARLNVDEAEEALATNEFSIVLERLVSSEAALVMAEQMVDAYRKELGSTAETISEGAVIVRNVSVGMLIGIGAVLATPVVAAGVSAGVSAGVTGAGFSGASATILTTLGTTLGTGTVVTGGGALIGGAVEAEVNVIEQALEGEGFNQQELLAKTGAGMKQGAVSALTGSVTAGTAGLLGKATTLSGHAVRGGVSGSAGGASGGGLGAALEGKSLWEIAEAAQLGGLEGAVGGAFGGASSHLTQGRSLIARVGIETLGGGLGSGLGAVAVGKSPEEIAQSVLIGSIAGGAVEFGMPATTGPKVPGSLAKRAPWEVFGKDVDYGIAIFRSGDDYVGVHPAFPDTVFIPRGNQPPKVFTRTPDGAIVEVPWPFQKRLTSTTEPAVPAHVPQQAEPLEGFAAVETVESDPGFRPESGQPHSRGETRPQGNKTNADLTASIKERGCFVQGTRVHTRQGPISIEELNVGDRVFSHDPISRKNAEGYIRRVFAHTVPIVLDIKVGKTEITCSPEHPFWVPGLGWQKASALKLATSLLSNKGQVVQVSSIRRREGTFKVFNIEVDGLHTYHVSDLAILVHNKPMDSRERAISLIQEIDLLREEARQLGQASLMRVVERLEPEAIRLSHLGQSASSPQALTPFLDDIGRVETGIGDLDVAIDQTRRRRVASYQRMEEMARTVTPRGIGGAPPRVAGARPGHARSGHGYTDVMQAEILNNPDRVFSGVYEGEFQGAPYTREVDIYWRAGDVVITEAGNKRSVITAFGISDPAKIRRGERTSAVDAEQKWANNPNYVEIVLGPPQRIIFPNEGRFESEDWP